MPNQLTRLIKVESVTVLVLLLVNSAENVLPPLT